MTIKNAKNLLLIPADFKIHVLSWTNNDFLKVYENSVDFDLDVEIEELELTDKIQPISIRSEEIVFWVK